MRRLICVLAVCLGVQIIVSAQVPGTASELADDALAIALWHIAAATHTKIGFESVELVAPWGWTKDVPAFSISSRDEALKATVDTDPRYEWRAIGDFVVVRPKSAWNDPANPFNRRVRNLRVENAPASGVLFGLRDFIYTNKFAVPPVQSTPVSFELQSGTVIDALNRLVESADAVLWIASYRPDAQVGQRYPGWGLQMQFRNARGLIGSTESHPPR